MTPTIAIVSTIRRPGSNFSTWLDYHSRLVDRIYLFLDEPGSGDELLTLGYPDVKLFAGDQDCSTVGCTRLIMRQAANMNRALALCAEEGIDWLLHIDDDELIWSPSGTLKEYLSTVDADTSNISFVNHEVVSTYQVDNCFNDLHLFKRNGFDAGNDVMLKQRKYPFFYFYGNGKSAGRVASCSGHDGPHQFRPASGKTRYETDVCILHYACADYEIWRKKFALLDDFPSTYFDNPDRPIPFNFQLDSRDAYLDAKRTGRWQIAQDFYRRSLFSSAEVERMVAVGAVVGAHPTAMIDFRQVRHHTAVSS